MLFYITGKRLIGARRGFLKAIGPNKLRIHLAETTQAAITVPKDPTSTSVKHISKLFRFLYIFSLFSTDPNEAFYILNNIDKY